MCKNKNIYVCRGDAWKEGGSEGMFFVDDIVSIKWPKNCGDATGQWYFTISLKSGDSFTCRSVASDTFWHDDRYQIDLGRNGEKEIKELYKNFIKAIGMAHVQE